MRQILIVGLLFLLGCVQSTAVGALPVTSYEECVAQGFKILRTYPPSCIGPEGKIYRAKREEILPESPKEKPSAARACVDKCGDGECQEMVCQAIGCPCSETEDSCPEDCAKKLP